MIAVVVDEPGGKNTDSRPMRRFRLAGGCDTRDRAISSTRFPSALPTEPTPGAIRSEKRGSSFTVNLRARHMERDLSRPGNFWPWDLRQVHSRRMQDCHARGGYPAEWPRPSPPILRCMH